MSDRYNPQAIEAKWQKAWDDQGIYKTTEEPNRPKWYALTMLPYPSGDLHTGHWYAFTPSDASARFKRMNGYNVFFPIGNTRNPKQLWGGCASARCLPW